MLLLRGDDVDHFDLLSTTSIGSRDGTDDDRWSRAAIATGKTLPRLDIVDDLESDARDAQDEQSAIQSVSVSAVNLATQFGRSADVDPVDSQG